MAYWVEHSKFGMELSLDPPNEDAVKRGWVATALYAAQPPAAPVERGNLAMTADEIAAARGLIGASPSSAVTEGAEEAIRDWWYSDRRQPMTSKEAAKSLIWYLAKCGFKIVREPQAGEWINEPLRNWTASTNEPQEAGNPLTDAAAALLEQYDFGAGHCLGVMSDGKACFKGSFLAKLDALKSALSLSRPQSGGGQ
jgi:hypothetical protein